MVGVVDDEAIGTDHEQGAHVRQDLEPLRQQLLEGRGVLGDRERPHGIGHALEDKIDRLEAAGCLLIEETAERGRPGAALFDLSHVTCPVKDREDRAGDHDPHGGGEEEGMTQDAPALSQSTQVPLKDVHRQQIFPS